MTPDWLTWVLRVHAIAQTGRHYARDPFDVERYAELQSIAAAMLARYSGSEFETVVDLFKQEVGHATPKIDVRGAVFRDDALLFTRERSSSNWTLPGGFAEVGKSPAEAVVREVREESGYEVRALRLVAVWDWAKHRARPAPFSCYKLFFECEFVGGSPASGAETIDVGFYRQDELPELDQLRVTADQIRRIWNLRRNSNRDAEFD